MDCSTPRRMTHSSSLRRSHLLLLTCALLSLTACAQLDQLMGKQDASAESQSTTQAPAAPEQPSGNTQVAPAPTVEQPVAKPAESKPAHAAKEPPAPVAAPAPAPVVTTPHPAPEVTPKAAEKALADKDAAKTEKKPRTTSDKKSKKKSKPEQAPAEDAFLPPVPLPSKPAAIGGSGG